MIQLLAKTKEQKRELVLHLIQPGLAGLMEGSVSSLAPLFAAALSTRNRHTTFLVGLATAVGAGISMALSETLSNDGKLSGRGNALTAAIVVVLIELLVIAWGSHRYMETAIVKAALQILLGGAIVFIAGILIGKS